MKNREVRKKKATKPKQVKPPKTKVDTEPQYSKTRSCLTFTSSDIRKWYQAASQVYYDNDTPELDVAWTDWQDGEVDSNVSQAEISVTGRRASDDLSFTMTLYMTAGTVMVQGKTLERAS